MMGSLPMHRCRLPSFSGRTELDKLMSKQKTVKKVNQYYLLKSIGEGSFAKVFLGFDLETNNYFAMKRVHLGCLSRSLTGISQLETEIDIMRKLTHPNIISLREVIHVPFKTEVYMVLQFADCGNLDEYLQQGISLSDDKVQYIFKQIVEGVSYLHQNAIVHQDLKPANIMLNHDGHVMISDFSVGHSFQNASIFVGSPAFQAPEVIDYSENPDEEESDNYVPGKEDIWSLGVTLYLMLFDELPFKGETIYEIINSLKSNTLEKPPFPCDDNLWELICGMLTIDKRDRLDIWQVKENKYVTEAPDFVDLELQLDPLPDFDPSAKTTEIKGKICKEGYSFSKSDNSYQSMLRSHSAPFRSPFG